jgi:hypothetical protein
MVNLVSIARVNFDRAYMKDDYRALAEHLFGVARIVGVHL